MNILIINGSPRKNGNLSRMLEAIDVQARTCGADTTVVRVSDMKVTPCTGCMTCRTRHECVLPEDDAQATLKAIRRCDILVIGAPCYWGNMPGTLKVLFDRTVYGMMGESRKGLPTPLHKGKTAMLVTTGTTPYPFNRLFRQTGGTVKALKEILKWSGFDTAASIQRGGTKQNPVGEKDLEKCRKAIRRIMASHAKHHSQD